MQILLIADIHANYRALKAVLDKYRDADEVWCLGDIVLCGPSPSACTALVRERCNRVVCNNHDPEYVRLLATIPQVCCDRDEPPQEDSDYLISLPETLIAEADGRTYYLVHCSPPPTELALLPDTDESVLREALRLAGTDVLLGGHTHIAMVLPVDDKFIVNAGALGQPEDGDPRAQCMLIEDGQFRFDRVEYDIAELERDYANSSMPEEHAAYYFNGSRRGYGDRRGIRLGPFSDPNRKIAS